MFTATNMTDFTVVDVTRTQRLPMPHILPLDIKGCVKEIRVVTDPNNEFFLRIDRYSYRRLKSTGGVLKIADLWDQCPFFRECTLARMGNETTYFTDVQKQQCIDFSEVISAEIEFDHPVAVECTIQYDVYRVLDNTSKEFLYPDIEF